MDDDPAYVWLSYTAVGLRILTGLVKLVHALWDRRRYAYEAVLDLDGNLEVNITNDHNKDLKVSRMRVVQDESFWWFLLRMIVGVDFSKGLVGFQWTKPITLPQVVQPSDELRMKGAIRLTRIDAMRLSNRKLRKAMIWIVIGGWPRLRKVHWDKGQGIPPPGKKYE